MKRGIHIFSLFAGLSLLFFSSCSKPDNGELDRGTFIRFTIDETEYYFENLTTSQYADKSNSNGTARIYPEQPNAARIAPDNTPITLYLPMDVSKGAHEVMQDGKPTAYKVAFAASLSGSALDFAHEGRIIIFNVTEHYVEGTFIAHVTSATSKEEVTLSDGRFRAYLN